MGDKMSDVPTIESLNIKNGTYQFFWLMGIKDVNLKKHCKEGLKGHTFKEINGKTTTLKNYPLDEVSPYKAYYLCGVLRRNDWSKNFHLAFKYKKGNIIEKNNGLVKVIIKDAIEIPVTHKDMIPGYPTLEDPYYHTCRNYRFAFTFLKLFKPEEYQELQNQYVTEENKHKYDDYNPDLPPRSYNNIKSTNEQCNVENSISKDNSYGNNIILEENKDVIINNSDIDETSINDGDLSKIFNSNKDICVEHLDSLRDFKNKSLNEQIAYLNGRRIRPSNNSNPDKYHLLKLTKDNVEDIKISLAPSNPLITIFFKNDVESYHNYQYYTPGANKLLVNPWNIL